MRGRNTKIGKIREIRGRKSKSRGKQKVLALSLPREGDSGRRKKGAELHQQLLKEKRGIPKGSTSTRANGVKEVGRTSALARSFNV